MPITPLLAEQKFTPGPYQGAKHCFFGYKGKTYKVRPGDPIPHDIEMNARQMMSHGYIEPVNPEVATALSAEKRARVEAKEAAKRIEARSIAAKPKKAPAKKKAAAPKKKAAAKKKAPAKRKTAAKKRAAPKKKAAPKKPKK